MKLKERYPTSNITLGYKFLLWIIVSSSVITVLSSTIQLWYEYRSEKKSIESKIQLIGESFSGVLAASVWNLDNKSLETHLSSMLVYPEVVHAEVENDLGQIIHTNSLKPDSDYLKAYVFDIHREDGKNEKLGILSLYISFESLNENIRSKGLFILVRQFFDIFLFSIIVLLIFELLVSRHLRILANHARTVDVKRLGEKLSLNRKANHYKDEIDLVVDSINKMNENLMLDVKNLEEVERNIKASENRFKRITQGANDGLWEFSIDGSYNFFSDQYKRMLGWEDISDESMQDYWEKNLHPGDKQKVLRALNRHLEYNDPFDIEYRVLTGTGEYKWVKAKAKAESDESGLVKYMSGSITEITDLKRANEEILLAKNEIEGYSKQLELVNRMASELGQAKTMKEILTISHRYLSLSLSDDLLSIFLYEPKEKMFNTYTLRNDGSVMQDMRFYPMESSITGLTLTENKIRFIPNFDKVNSVDLLPIHKKGMKSGVSIPLVSSTETIGVLQIASKHYNAFTNYDTRILKQIGSLIGINIQRKSYEERIVDREFQLKSVFESTTNIIYSVDLFKKYLSFNNKYKEVVNTFYGHNIEFGDDLEWVLRDFSSDRELIFENLDKALNGERAYSVDRFGNEEIGFFHFESFYNPIYNDEGEVIGASVFSNDITEKRLAEEELIKVQNRLEEAQRIAHVGNFEWDVTLDSIWWSNEVYQIFGMPSNKARPSIDMLFDRFHADSLAEFRSILARKQVKFRMAIEIDRSGEVRYIQVIGSNEFDEMGNHILCGGTFQDITEQKTQEKNKVAKEIAEQKSKHKDEFLANMSHEIRSPLNAIVGFSQILLSQGQRMDLPVDFKENLEHIKLSGQNLSELINNILDLSKIEAGKITYNYETLNLKQLFQGAYHINKNKAIEKGVHFQYDFSDNLPTHVVSDRTKLNQILMNLVSNAIKFTPADKTVYMTAKKNKETDFVEFLVKDEGIGIQQDRLPHIFETFEQADNSITRTFGGTGLGLAITKKLVESLGGEIEVYSEAGQGSSFQVSIPLKASEDTDASHEDPNLAKVHFERDNKILLVEDNVVNQELMASYFKELDLEYELAENGKEGFEKAEEYKPDLILMDMHMPVMDGMESTQKIRNSKDDEVAKIPIVAVSADAFVEQQDKVLALGVNDYITKPVDFAKLLPVLAKYLRKSEIQPETEDVARKELSDEIKREVLQTFEEMKNTPIFMTEQLLGMHASVQDKLKFYNHPWVEVLESIKIAIYNTDSQELDELMKGVVDG